MIKARQSRNAIGIYSRPQPLEGDNVKRIGGRDRDDMWVVEYTDQQLQAEGVRTWNVLQHLPSIEYSAPLFSANGETVAIIPEIVVRLKDWKDGERLGEVCSSLDLAIIRRLEFTELEYLIEVLGPDANAVFSALERLNEIPFIEWAYPNTVFQLHLAGQVIPNDEYFPNQWHLNNTGQSGGRPDADINAPEAWEITTGEPNVVIAVLDNGVDLDHPDLKANLVSGYDFYDDDDCPNPAACAKPPDPSAVADPHEAHGTACAGLVAARANNGIGITGVAWNCRIMPIRVGRGLNPYATEADIATAFRWSASNGADVFTNSWGYYSDTPIIHSAIVHVTKSGGIGRDGRGCVVLFAACNENTHLRHTAQYPEVIAVGAVDHNDNRSYYSNYGAELDIAGPSSAGLPSDLPTLHRSYIWTTDIMGNAGYNVYDTEMLDYALFGGTSAATPITAGVTALVLSAEPDLTSEEVRHFLTRSAKDLGDPGRDDYYGWGRVDARAALDMVLAKRSDLNDDWRVDSKDFAFLAQHWRQEDVSTDIAPATARDGYVGLEDVMLMCRYWQYEIPEFGLLAHWKLDETEGITAHDYTGSHDGTLLGEPQWQPANGAFEGALALDGVNDFIYVPFVLNPGDGAFSIFLWVKTDTPGKTIVSQRGTGGASWLAINAEGRLITGLQGSGRGAAPLPPGTVITDNQWHRVGLTWDDAYRTLYVDDIEVSKDTAPQGITSATGGLHIGADKTQTVGSYFLGLIDDVRIYNRAITP